MRYGTRAMLELALRYDQGPVSVREIAECQKLPVKYLEQVLTTLQAAELVHSVRGPKGGYRLVGPPRSISLRRIYEALEGKEGFVQCTGDPAVCQRAPTCATQEVWAFLYQTCANALESISLADLGERARLKQAPDAIDYAI